MVFDIKTRKTYDVNYDEILKQYEVWILISN